MSQTKFWSQYNNMINGVGDYYEDTDHPKLYYWDNIHEWMQRKIDLLLYEYLIDDDEDRLLERIDYVLLSDVHMYLYSDIKAFAKWIVRLKDGKYILIRFGDEVIESDYVNDPYSLLEKSGLNRGDLELALHAAYQAANRKDELIAKIDKALEEISDTARRVEAYQAVKKLRNVADETIVIIDDVLKKLAQ